MPILEGRWFADLYPKQWELMRLCLGDDGDSERYVLVHGPRFASKTIGCANAIAQHAWETDANIAIIVPSISVGTGGGFWELLTETVMPEWIAGDFGFEWWEKKGAPHQDGSTKQQTCVIKNKFGRKSRIQLISIKEEREVEKNFKNRNFTMLYVSEASEVIKKYESYNTLLNCLRAKNVPRGRFLLILDTNPPADGESNWMYREFFEFRQTNAKELSDADRIRQRKLHVIQFLPTDNLSNSKDFLEGKKSEFAAAGQDYYDRYWLGLWKKAKEGTLFYDVFKAVFHIIEQLPDEWIMPQENCEELITSWDFGPANPYVCFIEKFYHHFPGKPEEQSIFKFFDEIYWLEADDLSLGDFTYIVLERMKLWEARMGKKVRWTHYSDRSAFDVRESIANRYQYEEVFKASGGEIQLTAVDKSPGSVNQAIRLWRRMLIQQRLIFAALQVPQMIEMNKSLPSGKDGMGIAKNTPYKHPFDAGRYMLLRECWTENLELINSLEKINRQPMKAVSIPL